MAYAFNDDKSKYEFSLDPDHVKVQGNTSYFNTGNEVEFVKSGKVVTMYAELATKSRAVFTGGGWFKICNIPDGYKPYSRFIFSYRGDADTDNERIPTIKYWLYSADDVLTSKRGTLEIQVIPVNGSYKPVDYLAFAFTYITE